MYGWRITKYNPAFRNEQGAYLKDEWTSISEVGDSFDGKILTFEEYRKIEDTYVSTALCFLSESNIDSVKVNSLEKYNLSRTGKEILTDIEFNSKILKNNFEVSVEVFKDVCRLILRDVIWCRLESNSDFYVHFGWDYYMYIGSSICSEKAINFGIEKGLFVEEMMSPYLRDNI
jgi:hypothetical protein